MQEITRRVNLRGIWQAAYTAGVLLPKPVATAQYWHRSLNPKKLISVGFSRLAVRVPQPCDPPLSRSNTPLHCALAPRCTPELFHHKLAVCPSPQ